MINTTCKCANRKVGSWLVVDSLLTPLAFTLNQCISIHYITYDRNNHLLNPQPIAHILWYHPPYLYNLTQV